MSKRSCSLSLLFSLSSFECFADVINATAQTESICSTGIIISLVISVTALVIVLFIGTVYRSVNEKKLELMSKLADKAEFLTIRRYNTLDHLIRRVLDLIAVRYVKKTA